MSIVNSYRDLKVWQRSVDFGLQIYSISRKFPADEKFGMTSQPRRSATSVAANIAEGQARRTSGEYLQHLGIARGSLAEADTFLVFSKGLGFLKDADFEALSTECLEIGKMLNGLIRSVGERKARSSPHHDS